MMEILDALGSRYGVRPSSLLAESNPFRALAIDLWAFRYGAAREEVERAKARNKRRT